jgi:hypothetical protein
MVVWMSIEEQMWVVQVGYLISGSVSIVAAAVMAAGAASQLVRVCSSSSSNNSIGSSNSIGSALATAGGYSGGSGLSLPQHFPLLMLGVVGAADLLTAVLYVAAYFYIAHPSDAALLPDALPHHYLQSQMTISPHSCGLLGIALQLSQSVSLVMVSGMVMMMSWVYSMRRNVLRDMDEVAVQARMRAAVVLAVAIGLPLATATSLALPLPFLPDYPRYRQAIY